jgi:hypothetical protein
MDAGLVRAIGIVVVLPMFGTAAIGACVGDDPATPPTELSPVDAGADTASQPTDASVDTAVADGADASANGDGAVEPGGNIFPNGGMETDCSGSFGGAVYAPDSTAHGGSKSCRICRESGANVTLIPFTRSFPGPVVGSTYLLEAWVRSAAATPAPTNAQAFVRAIGPDVVEQGTSTPMMIDGTWRLLQATLVSTKSAQGMDVVVHGYENVQAGSCFLVDDVVVRIP